MVEGFKEYMNLVADKKCPDGFKFDSKLQVCVPKGHKYIRYPYFGRIGTTSKNADTDNGNGDDSNGNGGNGNGGNGQVMVMDQVVMTRWQRRRRRINEI